MANRRPNFEIPDVINPDGRRCIQFMIPDDPQHVAIFAGLTRQLLDWQRWERDPLKRGTQVAQVWREVWNNVNWSGEDCMGCCPEPTNRRYNENGELEVSYDGGVTWSPAPADDSRHSAPTAPPLEGADGEEKRCVGASSAQEYVKTAFIESLSTGATFADINAAMVAIVAALGVTGVGILIAAAVAAIFIAGISATQAAFTTEAWDEFRCILYCNMEDDASFTMSGWEGVKADILSTFTGIVSAVLYNWVNSVGTAGLTNTARIGMQQDVSCEACDCGGECVDESRVMIGTVVSITDNTITVESEFTTFNGHTAHWVQYGSDSNDFCCLLCDETVIGSISSSGWVTCDGTVIGTSSPDGQMIRQTRMYSDTGSFQVAFTFPGESGCP